MLCCTRAAFPERLDIFLNNCDIHLRQLLFDRVKMAEGVANIQCTTAGGHKLSAPPFVEVLQSEGVAQVEAKALAAGVRLPCILKDRSACGGEASHRMSLLLSWEGLQRPADGQPRILQSFVNHGGVIHKIYVIGDKVHVVRKASIADLPQSASSSLPLVLEFDSLLMGETLAKINTQEGLPPTPPDAAGASALSDEIVNAAVAALREQWPLTLFGFDVVVDHAGVSYVIDVNYFPSFKGFPHAAHHLQTALQHKLASGHTRTQLDV